MTALIAKTQLVVVKSNRLDNEWSAICNMSNGEKKSRMDRLFDRIESHGFESLTDSERSAFALVWLYREVNNGGFSQFFFNDAGKLAGDALRGLEFLGARATANILRRAMSVFPGGAVPPDQGERRQFICDSLTDDQNELLEKLDAEFYQSSEPTSDYSNSSQPSIRWDMGH